MVNGFIALRIESKNILYSIIHIKRYILQLKSAYIS
jgi:hypothetical protein